MNKEEKVNKLQEVDEAIRARIERFNRLWIAATGHSFEEDEAYVAEVNRKLDEEYKPQIEARLKELGFESERDYLNWIWDVPEVDGVTTPRERDQILQDLWDKSSHESSLYGYDKMVMDQARLVVAFLIEKCPEDKTLKEYAEELAQAAENDSFTFVQNLEAAGMEGWDPGHSSNSASQAIQQAFCLISRPDLFPYLHGALAMLVGDEGYHDDRNDIPKSEETEGEKEE